MKGKKYKAKDLTYYAFQIIKKPVKWYLHHKFNLNLLKNEAKDDFGPFLIIGNHVTAFDPIISLVYLRPLVKFVAADANYDNKIKTFFMKIARVIPISKRNTDIRTIKQLIAEVRAGNAVGLYPEGGRNWYGETEKIIKSTAKLIKLLGIKVYCQKLQGAYLSNPRWGKKIYKGKVDVIIYQMLSDKDVEKMTIEEIYQSLQKHLYHNEYEYQRKEMIKFSGIDRAEYVERVLYVCPNCNKIHTFNSKGNNFYCTHCLAKGTINNYGFIEGDFPFDNLVDWYHYQKNVLYNYLENNNIEPIVLNKVFYKLKYQNKKHKLWANIKISMDKMTIKYQNKVDNINYSDLSEVSITFKNTLIFYENKRRHEFVIEPFLHNNASIVYIKEILNYLREKSYAH